MTTEHHNIIVIGAGSAGCAIAARASENPHLQVLLLEAGPDYPELSTTPFDLTNSHNNSYRDHDWGLKYQPTQGNEVFFPRGRVVGGSSAVNTTIALRSLPEDHEEWAAAGNTEWSWDKVLPAFKRLERDLDFPEAPFHGDAGPISIRRYPQEELLPQHQAFLSDADRLGYPACPDANDPDQYGAGPQPMNKLGRLRVSCAIGYLAPARLRDNLEIRANTSATRLLVTQGRCSGVVVEDSNGNSQTLNADLVVLCGGAIGSPTLLLRSGIGPADELNALGIDACTDIAGIGKNLCDHPALSVVCNVRDASLIDHDAPLIQTILRYTAEGSDKRNDLQIEQLSFAGRPDRGPRFAIAAVLEYQYGRGELRLRSKDPADAPIIDNRFCEDERDARRLASCFRDTLAFTREGELADMIADISFPNPQRGFAEDTLMALCRSHSGSGYHPSGTVKMGPASDPQAVVDQYGCAHAIDQLVVADAAIMPSVPRANTNLTSIMIGEKIGDWLRQQPGRYGL